MIIVSFFLGIVVDSDGNRIFKGEYRQGILFGKCKEMNNQKHFKLLESTILLRICFIMQVLNTTQMGKKVLKES